MYCKPRFVGVLIALLVSSPITARSQSARVSIFARDYQVPGETPCTRTLFAGIQYFEVRLDATAAPVKRVRLKVELSISGGPVTWWGPANQEIDVVFPYGIHAGDMIEHFTLFLPVPGTTGSCTFKIIPMPGASHIELTDMNDNPMVGAWTHDNPDCADWSAYIAPYLPLPVNGATNVPTNALLSYTGPANMVVFGVDPTPRSDDPDAILCTAGPFPEGSPPCVLPLDPGPLAPYTTYYWRAYNTCFACEHGEGAVSEIFSFTTGAGPLATERATWGRVKAMYRE